MCFRKKTSTSTTSTTPPAQVLANYNYVNELAKAAASKPFQKYGTQASDFVAQINPQQTMGISGINAAANSYQPYMTQATEATNAGMGPAYAGIDNYMSPYIKNVADTTAAMMRQQQEQAQSGALGNAVSSGAFGGDRAGIAAANLQQQNQMAYGKSMADIYNQGYTQALGASQADLARQLQGGAQLAGIGAQTQQLGLAGGQAQIAAGSLQQQTEQAGKDALINQFMQEQGYPFQTAQFLANIYTSTGPASGTQTTNVQPGSFWSDRRLKHDVQRIGRTDDGQPIYRFKYNGSNQVQMGLMADQVEKHHPDAVGTDPKTGYQYVDYDRATKHMASGGVAGPYQITIGSSPGSSGYMPENYVRPTEMLLPDASWIDSVTQRNEEKKTGLQDLIDNISRIKDTWNDFQGIYQPKASGGSVDDNVKDDPVARGYLQPILDAMAGRKVQELLGASNSSGGNGGGSGGGGGGLGGILDTALKVKNLFGFEQGGVVGDRHGYDLGGTPSKWEMMLNDRPGVDSEFKALGRRALTTVLAATPFGPALGRMLPDLSTVSTFQPATTGVVLSNAVDKDYKNLWTAEDQAKRDAMIAAQRAAMRAEAPAGGVGAGATTPAVTPATGVAPTEAAPTTSPFPPKRPTGLGAADVADAAMVAIGKPNLSSLVSPTQTSSVIDQTPATSATKPSNWDMADTGLAPTGGYKPIIPLKTQLQFVTSELQQPEYRSYLENTYATPAQAAVAFEQIYERAKGAGNDVASAYATDIHKAALDGKLNDLPPNVAEAYNHFIQNGMDPIKAAGATGRLMVESYAHLDPNARNTLGGGYGTYGLAQWRGSRMEELANFAGVPLETLVNAPVSTPEGRYYSHGADFTGGPGGGRQVSGDGLDGANMARQRDGLFANNKPYEDRNFLGQIFHNNDTKGGLNRDAVMSLLTGVGTMLASPSQFFLPTLGAGLAAGANTYMAREGQRADITAQNLENLKKISRGAMEWNEMNGTNLSPLEYAKVANMTLDPATKSALEAMSPSAAGASDKITYRDLQTGMVTIDGRNVRMQDDPTSLQRFITDNGWALNDPSNPLAAQVSEAQTHLNNIVANGYKLRDADTGESFISKVESNAADAALRAQANREDYAALRLTARERTTPLQNELDLNDRQAMIFTRLRAGALTDAKSQLAVTAQALGIPVPADSEADRAAVVEAIKGSARAAMSRLGSGGGPETDAQLAQLNKIVESIDMPPDAAKTILATNRAILLHEKAKYDALREWEKDPNNAADTLAFEQWFNQTHPLSEAIDQAYKELPMFKGETVTAENAPEGTRSVDAQNRPIVKRGGVWVLDAGAQP